MFGWHLAQNDADISRTHVMVFRKKAQAQACKRALVAFREHQGTWPSRQLFSTKDVPILFRDKGCQSVVSSNYPIVQQTELEGLSKRLAKHNINLDVVEMMDEHRLRSISFENELPLDIYRQNLDELFCLQHGTR